MLLLLPLLFWVVIPEGDLLLLLPLLLFCRHPSAAKAPSTDRATRTASPFQPGHNLGIAR